MNAKKTFKKWPNHDMCVALYQLRDLCQELAGKYHLGKELLVKRPENAKLEKLVVRALKQVDRRTQKRTCKKCGCTDDDCRGCVAKTGIRCHWIGPNLCSACR